MTVEVIWKEYKRTNSDSLRNQLVMKYLWMIKHLAGRLAIKLPAFMAQEALESSGVFGLVEAVQKFDPDMGIEFEAYAYRRIRGSMIDEIRKANWMPRNTWQKLQDLKAVREKLDVEGKNTEENAAVGMGISVKELRKLESQFQRAFAVSLDESFLLSDGDVKVGQILEDTGSPDPFDMVAEEEGKAFLAKAISLLQEKEQLLLALYYQEGLTLKEIGRVLEVSESRVCQLHGRAIGKLKKIMQENYN